MKTKDIIFIAGSAVAIFFLIVGGGMQNNIPANFIIRVYGQSPEPVNQSVIDASKQNTKLINQFASVMSTCTDDITSGDYSTLENCIAFTLSVNKHFRALFNESQSDIQAIILGPVN